MTKNQLPRRSLLSGMLGSIAGLVAGLGGGKAKADDLKVMERAAGTLEPIATIEPVGYQYQLVEIRPAVNPHIPFLALWEPRPGLRYALEDMDRVQKWYPEGKYSIIRRRVGEWEMMQLPKPWTIKGE